MPRTRQTAKGPGYKFDMPLERHIAARNEKRKCLKEYTGAASYLKYLKDYEASRKRPLKQAKRIAEVQQELQAAEDRVEAAKERYELAWREECHAKSAKWPEHYPEGGGDHEAFVEHLSWLCALGGGD